MASKKGKNKQKRRRGGRIQRGNHVQRRLRSESQDLEDDAEKLSFQLCECCLTYADVSSFCGICEGFICPECLENHQPDKLYGHHHGSTIDKIPDTSRIEVLGIPTCPKHYLQRLDFFCVDCAHTACYHCSLTDHKPPEHNLKDLDDIANATKDLYDNMVSKVQSPVQIFRSVSERVKIAEEQFLNQTLDIKDTLYNRSKKMTATVRTKGHNLQAEVVALRKARRKALVPAKKSPEVDDHLRTHRANVISKMMIRVNEMEFVTLRAGVAYGLERIFLATENETDIEKRLLEQSGNDRQLSGNGKKQYSNRSKRSNPNNPKIAPSVKSTFNAISNEPYINPLFKIVETHWEEQLKVGEVGEEEEGQFQYARCVTISQNGDIIVADDIRRRVYIFDNSGKYMTLFHPDQSYVGRPVYACSLALTSKNQVVVADLTIYVKIFTYNGTFLRQVVPFSSDEHYDDRTAMPCCVAVDANDNIIVGDHKRKVISIVQQSGEEDGTVLAVIHTDLRPSFVAFNAVNNLILFTEACTHNGSVVVIDRNRGNRQKTFVEAKAFGTHSVCCNAQGETFVMFESRSGPKTEYSIHLYNANGRYVGAVTKGLEYPGGMHITPDGLLAVAHGINVILYRPKGSTTKTEKPCIDADNSTVLLALTEKPSRVTVSGVTEQISSILINDGRISTNGDVASGNHVDSIPKRTTDGIDNATESEETSPHTEV